MAKNPRSWPVGFDQLVHPEGAHRPLTDLERSVIYLYAQITGERTEYIASDTASALTRVSNTPRPADFDSRVRVLLRERFQDAGILKGLKPSEQLKYLKSIQHQLFSGLFFTFDGGDIRDELDATQLIRRLCGLGQLRYTESEIVTALIELDEALSDTQGHRPDSLVKNEVIRASDSLWIVPSLGIPMPTAETILNILKKDSWFDVIEEVFGTDQTAGRKRRLGISLDELENDYAQFTLQLREEKGDPHYIPTHGDLVKRFEENPNAINYKQYKERLSKEGLTIDDLREALGLERSMSNDYLKRPTIILWSQNGTLSATQTQTNVMNGFLRAWSHFTGKQIGTVDQIKEMIRTTEPPTVEQLNDLSRELTKKIVSGVEGEHTPHDGIVHDAFGGMNPLLARIEKKYDTKIKIDSTHRLAKLASSARDRGLSINEAPECVMAHIPFLVPRGQKAPNDSLNNR